jgi:patatin-like phospholipase/acyl hydrolase
MPDTNCLRLLANCPWNVFKTPHRPHFVRDRYFKAVDVIMATTAAPSYFACASIEAGTLFCDGGIWASNPALVGYVEAVKISKECTRPSNDQPFTEENIYLLSIGTGRASYFVKPNTSETGIMWWAPRLLNISSEAQSEGIQADGIYVGTKIFAPRL